MNAGIGKERTRPQHREWSDQLYATYARGREARTMAAIVGESGLPEADHRALTFADRFEREFVGQPDGRRTIDETFEHGWQLLDPLPRDDLVRMSDATLDARRAVLATREAEAVAETPETPA
jgi:V/A-type H+-transporting ATPase subunit B